MKVRADEAIASCEGIDGDAFVGARTNRRREFLPDLRRSAEKRLCVRKIGDGTSRRMRLDRARSAQLW